MKASIKECYSTDIDDLFEHLPVNPIDFGFPLSFIVGPMGEPGEESFDCFVCTPAYLARSHSVDEVVFGRHLVIVQRYDFNNILDVVAKYITSFDEKSWETLAEKIGRIGKWEFEDYQPFTGKFT